jgi:hypothetical protein
LLVASAGTTTVFYYRAPAHLLSFARVAGLAGLGACAKGTLMPDLPLWQHMNLAAPLPLLGEFCSSSSSYASLACSTISSIDLEHQLTHLFLPAYAKNY